MLVLTRFEGESVILGDCIEIEILRVTKSNEGKNEGKQKIRLGITAPKALSIHRKEIYDKINRDELLLSMPAVSG